MRCILTCLLCLLVATRLAATELHVLNWSTFIDFDSDDESIPAAERSPTLRAFAAANDCRIVYTEYETEEQARQLILNMPHHFDVAIISNYMVDAFVERKWLQAIDPEVVPNRALVHPAAWRSKGDPEHRHYLPYLAGTTGFIYRRDLVTQTPSSIRQYFEPDETMLGHLGMLDEVSVMFCLGLLEGGFPVDNPSDGNLREAGRRLASLIRGDAVALLSSNIASIRDGLADGSVRLTPLYSGDAYQIRQELGAERIAYLIPEEGCEFFVDNLTVLRDSKHPELAMRLVNHLQDPQVQEHLARELGYISTNRHARAAMQAHQRAHDPILNPSDAELERCVVIAGISHRELAQQIWQALRQTQP